MRKSLATVLRFPSRFQAALFLLSIAAPAVLLATEALRIIVAQSLAESRDASNVERAIALDPNNPELHYRLGNLYLSEVAADPADAVASMRRATELNPNHWKYWLGLAQASFLAGDRDAAAQGFERAAQLAPLKPAVGWQAAAYYAATGNRNRMFSHLRRLLELTRGTASAHDGIFRMAWRATDDPALVWQNLVRPSEDATAEYAFVVFLSEMNRLDLAGQYWAEMVSQTAGRQSPDLAFDAVHPYLERLIDARQYEQAATVWRDLLHLGVVTQPAFQANGNLIFNGSFERPILNSGFDWRMNPGNFLSIDSSDGTSQNGRHALRVEFTAPHNAEDEPVYQFVPVTPNQGYRLTAYTRSEEISSDSGPRLRVVDLRCPACLDVSTEATVGTTAWHKVSVAFATGPRTDCVRLSLWRPRSRSFPMEIEGQIWLDDVALYAAVNPVLTAASAGR